MNPLITPQDDGQLRLLYRLHDLPTTQHKAGLAGLLFHAQNMQSRGLGPSFKIARLTPAEAEIIVGPDSLRATFDDLYAATWREVFSIKKWPGMEPKRIVDVPVKGDSTGKMEKRFVYDVLCPVGEFFAHLIKGGAESLYLKLWQDMLWAVLRAQPVTRGAYEARDCIFCA